MQLRVGQFGRSCRRSADASRPSNNATLLFHTSHDEAIAALPAACRRRLSDDMAHLQEATVACAQDVKKMRIGGPFRQDKNLSFREDDGPLPLKEGTTGCAVERRTRHHIRPCSIRRRAQPGSCGKEYNVMTARPLPSGKCKLRPSPHVLYRVSKLLRPCKEIFGQTGIDRYVGSQGKEGYSGLFVLQ